MQVQRVQSNYNKNINFNANQQNLIKTVSTIDMPKHITKEFEPLKKIFQTIKLSGKSYKDRYYLETRINNSKLEAGLNIATENGERYSVKLTDGKIQSLQPLENKEEQIADVLHSANLDIASLKERSTVYKLNDSLEKEIEDFSMTNNLKYEQVFYKDYKDINGKEKILSAFKDKDRYVCYVDEQSQTYYFPNYEGYPLVSYKKRGDNTIIQIYKDDFIKGDYIGDVRSTKYQIKNDNFENIKKIEIEESFHKNDEITYYEDRLSAQKQHTRVRDNDWGIETLSESFDREGNRIDYDFYN